MIKLLKEYNFIFISFYFLLVGCNQETSSPLDILPTDNTNKYYRDFDYDQNIILENKLDLNDFKKIYTEAEILKILGDSINIAKHPSIIIEPDFFYVNIYSLVHYSYDIIEGIVEKVEPRWDSDHKFIYTYKTITIEKTIKTKINLTQLIICDIGGELDGYKTWDAHDQVPIYNEGEDILCFIQYRITQSGDTTYSTYGRCQGIFVLFEE
jgi:hypothetical protein